MSKGEEPTPAGQKGTGPQHPGHYVRDTVLPDRGVSGTEAAELLELDADRFSSFLDGAIPATPELAASLERAFSIPTERLLELQTSFDAADAKKRKAGASTMRCVAPFLDIKARDIEAWADRNIPARGRFSVFLRTLINSTVSGITTIDFPGNDDSQTPGWDGRLETSLSNPWIPEGSSGWEFGTSQDPKAKADKDFAKSVEAVPSAERMQTTFIFVTPQHWPGKTTWTNEHRARGDWKDVRVYDSSDLEQWLEQSHVAQVWFANETQRPYCGIRSLDKCWTDWASVTAPALVGSLFTPAVVNAKGELLRFLSKQPGKPIVVAADSTEEALAFLAQAFGPAGGNELSVHRDRVLVFDEPRVLPRLALGTTDFIAVTANRDVEREFGPLSHSAHTVVIYPRNGASTTPDVVLEPLGSETFRSSLEEMRFGPDDVTRYENESGRSLSVLRRRLATTPAIKTPGWASDHETAAQLVPFLLIGAWRSTNCSDQAALTLLAPGSAYEDLERRCQHLATQSDPPLWSVGEYRGVVSKIDLLFTVSASVTKQDLDLFFDLAKLVLAEEDPALDLPDDERWLAPLHGKSREFSGALRSGLAETLVLLSIHGRSLFKQRLGIDCELVAARLVRDLMKPLTLRVLESRREHLPALAEASPAEFLSIIEEDLRADHPATEGLMRPASSGISGSCPRTNLLWALEGLAWSPETLDRTALILARLAGVEIDDNRANKPFNSLLAVFRAWMPQTAADHGARVRTLKLLAGRFPAVAWRICVEQLHTGESLGHPSYKPKWRNSGYGFGEPIKTWPPIHASLRAMLDLVLNWAGAYTPTMLCDLVQRIRAIPMEAQNRVWNLVSSWATGKVSDSDRALVREAVRLSLIQSRRLPDPDRPDPAPSLTAARRVYQELEPSDLILRYAWLFHSPWVELPNSRIPDNPGELRKRDELICRLKSRYLREIYLARGPSGILEFAELGDTASQIGWLTVQRVIDQENTPAFLKTALKNLSASPSRTTRTILMGALRALEDSNALKELIGQLREELSEAEFVDLLLLAPFRRSVWEAVDELDEQRRGAYWTEVEADAVFTENDEVCEAVERLLATQRPRAAFCYARYQLKSLGPDLLLRLMLELPQGGKDQPDRAQLESYWIEHAFKLIDDNPELTLDQRASLELQYLEILTPPRSRREGYGIPNLEKYVEANPDFYVQVIVWTRERRDGLKDPAKWLVPPEHAETLHRRGRLLLDALQRVPGHDDHGELQADLLHAWIARVRSISTELARLDFADHFLGQLLSHAPVGTDGVWPSEPVRQAMEAVQSSAMMEGARIGRLNSRGVVWRERGGKQEWALATSYRDSANALRHSHPFLAAELLLKLAETYEREAESEDTRDRVKTRLQRDF